MPHPENSITISVPADSAGWASDDTGDSIWIGAESKALIFGSTLIIQGQEGGDAVAYYTYDERLAGIDSELALKYIKVNSGSPEEPKSSSTEAQIVDLICEGPIEGFCDKNGQTIRDLGQMAQEGSLSSWRNFTDINRASKSIFLDDTPVKSENGFLNFTDFLCDYRPGFENQNPMSLNRTQGRTVMLNKDLYPSSNGVEQAGGKPGGTVSYDNLIPVGGMKGLEKGLYMMPYTVTDPNVTEVIIGINIRALSRTVQGKRASKVKTSSLSFLVYAGNEGEEYFNDSHVPLWGTKKSLKYQYNRSMGGYMIIRGEGYSSADYIFQVKIILPPNPNKKNRIIKVGRIDGVDTNPNDDAQGVAHSQFRSATELLPYLFNHPHSALVGVSFDSRSYSSVPERKYLLKLQKVHVPSNYIAETRKYAGNWNGLFKTKASYLDLYSMGESLSERPYIYSRPQSIAVNPSNKTTVNSSATGAFGIKGILSFPLAGATPRPANGATHGSDKIIRVYDGPKEAENANIFGPNQTNLPGFHNFYIGDNALSYLPLGTFGRQNFTIEFMIKVDTSQLKVVKNVDGATSFANGSADVRKVIIASDDNSGMGAGVSISAASDDQIIEAGKAMQLYGDSNPYKDIGMHKDIRRQYVDMGVLNGGWRVEVGTDASGDLGKIYFRSFSSNGITSHIYAKEKGEDITYWNNIEGVWNAFRWANMTDLDLTTFSQQSGLAYQQNLFLNSHDAVLENNKWHHVAIVRNGALAKLFLDGVVKTQSIVSLDIPGVNGLRMYGGQIDADGTTLSAAGRGEVTIGGSRTPIVESGGVLHDSTFVGSLDNIRISLQPEYREGQTYFTKDGSGNITGASQTSDADFPSQTALTRLLLKMDSGEIQDENRIVVDSSYFSAQVGNITDDFLQWTDNPAWIYYDLATNPRYGMGKYGVDKSLVDKWALYEISKYCDELVKTGFQPKYRERNFIFVDDGPAKTGDSDEDAWHIDWRTYEVAGSSMIKIDGFENQAQFEKEFPEGAVINIYDLNDKNTTAHQRQITYYREPIHGPWRVDHDRQLLPKSLTSYSNSDPKGSGHAWVILIDLVSVEEAISLDFSLKDSIRVGYSAMSANNSNIKQTISEREFIVGSLLGSSSGSPAAVALLKGSPVNTTSVSGKVCCEFNTGYPVLEPRFTANIYIDSVTDGLRVLNDVAAIFRGITYYMGGKIVPTFDKKQSPIMVFTNSNVKDGNFMYSGTPKDERYTVCKVRYNDAKDSYKQRIEFIEDASGVIRYGYNEKDLAALGCTSRGQARRLGKWFLFTAQHETETVSFATGKQAAYLRPGDVIKTLDKNRTSQRNFGRVISIESVDSKKIKIDSELDERLIGESVTIEISQRFETVERLNYRADHNFITNEKTLGIDTAKISDEDIENMRKPQLMSFTIKNIEKDTSVTPHQNTILELNEPDSESSFFGKIKVGAAFSVSRLNETIKVREDLFRIINVKQVNLEEYEVNCLEHNPTKHESVDFSQELTVHQQEDAPALTRPAKMISPPKVNIINTDPQNRQLLVSWDSVNPTPYSYHVVLYLVAEEVFSQFSGGSVSHSGGGLKTQQRGVFATDSSGVLLPTNVIFNIGSFVGEVKVNIWTRSQDGREEVVYF